MTHTNNITCEFVPGIGFFAEVCGEEYRSTDGVNWLRSNGNHPGNQMLIALRAAAYEAMGKTRDCPKSLDNRDTTDTLDPATNAGRRAFLVESLEQMIDTLASALENGEWSCSRCGKINFCYCEECGLVPAVTPDCFFTTFNPLDPATEASVQRGIDQARRGELHKGPEIPPVDTPDPIAGLTEPEPETFSGDPREWGVGTYRSESGNLEIGVWPRKAVLWRNTRTTDWGAYNGHNLLTYTRISTTPPRIVVEGAEQ